MVANENRALGWDDEIEKDGSRFLLLPAGEYPFRVAAFTRAHHERKEGGKIPSCNKAVLRIEVGEAEASTAVEHNLFLHSSQEWKLCEFFRSIGVRQHCERVRMDWTNVVGATGRCKVGVRDWTGKDNAVHQSNEIKSFLDPAEPTAAAPKDDMPF